MSIQELKRISAGSFTEEQYKEIADKVKNKRGNDANKMSLQHYDDRLNRTNYGYDEYMVDVLDFEFISVDTMFFEEKKVDTVITDSTIKVFLIRKSLVVFLKELPIRWRWLLFMEGVTF